VAFHWRVGCQKSARPVDRSKGQHQRQGMIAIHVRAPSAPDLHPPLRPAGPARPVLGIQGCGAARAAARGRRAIQQQRHVDVRVRFTEHLADECTGHPHLLWQCRDCHVPPGPPRWTSSHPPPWPTPARRTSGRQRTQDTCTPDSAIRWHRSIIVNAIPAGYQPSGPNSYRRRRRAIIKVPSRCRRPGRLVVGLAAAVWPEYLCSALLY
jgi:hypothetical protein